MLPSESGDAQVARVENLVIKECPKGNKMYQWKGTLEFLSYSQGMRAVSIVLTYLFTLVISFIPTQGQASSRVNSLLAICGDTCVF